MGGSSAVGGMAAVLDGVTDSTGAPGQPDLRHRACCGGLGGVGGVGAAMRWYGRMAAVPVRLLVLPISEQGSLFRFG